MTIQKTMTKAIQGGWRPTGDKNDYHLSDVQEYFDNGSAFLDPLFWQSLGKALGWDFMPMLHYSDRFSHRERAEWEHHWHRFIDHLADGGTAESFFKDL